MEALALKSDLFKSLADPTRLTVVIRLACANGPMTVTEVAGCCGVHLSGVSRHLTALKTAGLVDVARAGREARYQLRRDELCETLRGFADALEECCR